MLKENMSTSSMAAQTQAEEQPTEDVVRVKEEALQETEAVCSVAAHTQEEECARKVAVHLKVEPLLVDTASTCSMAAHTQAEESSREVVCAKDPSWIETESDCSVSTPTQEKECPMVIECVKIEPLLEDSLTTQKDVCSMGEVAMKKEALWKETKESCSMAHTGTNWSREEARVKKELLLEASRSVIVASQEEEQSMQKETATCSTILQTQKVVCVKEESSLMNTTGLSGVSETAALGLCGVSKAAIRAGLYAGHTVKDELVVGPECLQPPDSVFTREAVLWQWRAVRREHSYARERAPVGTATGTTGTGTWTGTTGTGTATGTGTGTGTATGTGTVELTLCASRVRACSVRLERCDRLLKPQTLDTEPSPRNNNYECDTCAKTYPYKSYLVRHIHTHLKSKVPKLKRKQCAKDTDSSIQRKKSRALNTLIQDRKEKEMFTCETCGKELTRKGHLRDHILIHEDVKSHICPICNKGFRRLDNLKRHGRTHTGEKPYSCDVCNKNFTQLGNLTAHKRIHLNLKPYICEICNNRFRDLNTLKRHKNTHFRNTTNFPKITRPSEKRFCCTICRKSFTRLCSLNIHKRIHSGEKPYSCDICTKRFSRRDTLLCHVLGHAGEGLREIHRQL